MLHHFAISLPNNSYLVLNSFFFLMPRDPSLLCLTIGGERWKQFMAFARSKPSNWNANGFVWDSNSVCLIPFLTMIIVAMGTLPRLFLLVARSPMMSSPVIEQLIPTENSWWWWWWRVKSTKTQLASNVLTSVFLSFFQFTGNMRKRVTVTVCSCEVSRVFGAETSLSWLQ